MKLHIESSDVQSEDSELPLAFPDRHLRVGDLHICDNTVPSEAGEMSTFSRVVAWSFKYGPRVGGVLMLLIALATFGLNTASVIANTDMVKLNTDMVEVNTAQLEVAQAALREAHEQDRRQMSLSQQGQWDPATQFARASVKSLWPDETESGEAIPIDKILLQVEMERKKGVVVTVDYHFNTILNFLEHLAQSVNAGIADEPLAKEAFREQVMMWVTITSELRAYRDKQRGGVPGFIPLMALHEKWSEKPAPAVTLPPTGVANP